MAERTQDAKPEDSWEPEMPMTWLVRDTRAFGVDGKTSPADHPVDLRLRYKEWFAIYFEALGLAILAIELNHVIASADPEPETRDPFDRLLLAQCQVENLRLVTVDRALVNHRLALNI